MILQEFFSKPLDVHRDQKNREKNPDKMKDELFWYMIDHDRLHKDYFFPISKKLKGIKECSPEMVLELYMPMVVKGCKEYHKHNKMQSKLGKCFPMEMREDMCKRLHDHYATSINKGK